MCGKSASVTWLLVVLDTINTPHTTTDDVTTVFGPGDVTVEFDQIGTVACVTTLNVLDLCHGTCFVTELKFFHADDVVGMTFGSFIVGF